MTQSPNPHTPQTPPTFEQSLARLEQIVQQLEDGRTDLAASLAGYEEGVKLLRQCHSLLERAERKIEQLSGIDADGNPLTEPFDDAATISLEDKAQNRAKRRSTKKPSGGATESAPDAGSSSGSARDSVDGSGSLF